jgi:peroxiredoxin (alkyl hydroperoxide reductase subunit C)
VIEPGTPAPEFTLARAEGGEFTREDLAGQTSVLVFYPFAFSPVCTDQMGLYDEVRGELASRGATLYGVSIEQLSDFEPKGETCRAFGVYHPGGFPQRALVIIDPDGVVKWSYQADSPGDLPGANLIFDGLAD